MFENDVNSYNGQLNYSRTNSIYEEDEIEKAERQITYFKN